MKSFAVCLYLILLTTSVFAQTGADAPARSSAGPAPGVLQISPAPDFEQPDPPGGSDEAGLGALAGHPHITAPRTPAPPQLDGRLDDAIWRTAVKISKFVQERPIEAADASEQTEVYLAYDNERIYVGVYAHYSNPGLIRANRADRDQIGRDDTVTVFFDPFLDQQRAYAFSVNGYGVQADSLMVSGSGQGQGGGGGGDGGGGGGGGSGPGGGGSGGGGGGSGGGGGGGRGRGSGIPGDPSWDALFYTAGKLVEDGWTAEMAIPFKSLRYPARSVHRWGFQVKREIQSKNEADVWAPVSRNIMGFIAQFGVLDGIRQVSTSRNLEILPTVTAINTNSMSSTTGTRSTDNFDEGGIGIKYGVTSNLTLDFTFNPDFSQVESDRPQIAVNQRFPLFFPEQRPFFLEGQEIFSVPGPVTMVHTRTIVDPRYGAKLTGKVGRTTVGLVVADDQAPGRVDSTDPAFGRSAHNVFGRVRYDLYSESHIGVIATDREFMDQYSRLGGLDGQFRFGRNQRLAVRTVATQHRDSSNVERRGHLVDIAFRKEARRLAYSLVYFEISPEFRTDAGFVSRTDQRQAFTNLSYRWWPESWIVNWGPRFTYMRNYQFDGTLQEQNTNIGWQAQFARNVFVNAGTDRGMERYLGIDFDKVRYNFGGGVSASRKISVGGFISAGDQIRYVENPYQGRGLNYNVFTTVRPFSRLQSELSLLTSRFIEPVRDVTEFNIRIYRALTTFQLTPRLLVRNILDYNNYDGTLGGNLLATYRVNAGTVFFVGYDDRYRQANQFSSTLFSSSAYTRINRALFAKLQVLLRY